MQVVKKFNHPCHYVNTLRLAVKRSLSDYTHKLTKERLIPTLNKELAYYFIFETQPRNEVDQMVYALCCFAEDGEIIFSIRSAMPVSLWRYRRQGMAQTASMIQGVIKSQFKRFNVPLHKDCPFSLASDGLYVANICWFTYKQLLS